MNIRPTESPALQSLQAQQAFSPPAAHRTDSRADSMETGVTPKDEVILSAELKGQRGTQPAQEQTPQKATGKPAESPASGILEDVQRIAQKVGYVGLSQQAIERAMVRGESLMADYRA